MNLAVVSSVANVLAHVPGLVRYGSRPARDIGHDPETLKTLVRHLRSYDDAVRYAPNRAYVGDLEPEDLRDLPRPWFATPGASGQSRGAFGDIISEPELLALLKRCDRAGLVRLDQRTVTAGGELLRHRDLLGEKEAATLQADPATISGDSTGTDGQLPLWLGQDIVGSVARGHEDDEALTAPVLLENLCVKATGVLALRRLLSDVSGRTGPNTIECVISGSEEAVGDRYQRGGGNMAKAIAEEAGLQAAGGFDIKSFCASTLYALANAAALIQAGVFSRVVVVAGGSLAKLGMKYRAHVTKGMPILEDVLAGIAILVERMDIRGQHPIIRLDTLGLHTVGAGSSQQAILEALVIAPLTRAGYRLTDVDRFVTEMHNPEVTEPAGSGDVPMTNYRLIAALGALRGEISKEDAPRFVRERGLPGFAPTQGHIASAVCYLAHACRGIRQGRFKRILLMAKGSLFLGRMTQMSDGVSFLIEA